MDLNEYLTKQREEFFKENPDLLESGFDHWVAKWIRCKDGFKISVQSNSGAYSSPRDGVGPWHMVECGFPSEVPTEIMQYCEDPYNPTGTVYGYVPIELVEQMIENHGGFMREGE